MAMNKDADTARPLITTVLKRILKTVLAVVVLVIAVVVGGFFVLNSSAFQDRMLRRATRLLSDKLQTRVHIDSISVGLFRQDVRLYGLDVADRQQRQMLHLDTLSVTMDVVPLLHNKVHINQATVKGVNVLLLKEEGDSVPNYQFALDVFKRDGKRKTKEERDTIKNQKFVLGLYRMHLERVNVTYNDQHYSLGSLNYDRRKEDSHTATIRQLHRTWVSHTRRRGDIDNLLQISMLTVVFTPDKRYLTLEEAHFVTNNHLPRKNKGKPHRGFFDAGHLDVMASMHVTVTNAHKDSLAFSVSKCRARDVGSGLNVDSLRFHAAVDSGVMHLRDVHIALHHTKLHFDRATVQLPNKRKQQALAFQTSPITGKVLLKDIARPFAPVLSNFTLPLTLQTTFSGTNEALHFRNVRVATTDRKLQIRAFGDITNLKDSRQLKVQFHVADMMAQGGIKERIIRQFPVKRFMMEQLNRLGTIHYTGDFRVLWRREEFQGLLKTAAGPVNFNFALDGQNKYVSGFVTTDSFMLGKVMDLPDIGKLDCQARFRFDISKVRTAKMRRIKGGKLPIGEVDAEVREARYKKVKVRNIVATMQSDGALAEGKMTVKGKRVDVLCNFSFTNTSEMNKMKVKPGIRFHKLSDEDKAARDERRQQKKAEKAARREQKKAEKAARREQEAAEKAQRREQKAAEKAARREQKAAEKAARREQKEREKSAR